MVTWRLLYRENAGMRNVRGAGSESRCGVSRFCRVWHPLFRVSRSGACHVNSQLSTNHSVLPGARRIAKRLQRFYAPRHIHSGLTYPSVDAGLAMPSCSRYRGEGDGMKEKERRGSCSSDLDVRAHRIPRRPMRTFSLPTTSPTSSFLSTLSLT